MKILTKIAALALMVISFACVSGACASGADDPHGDFIYAQGTNLMLRGKPFRYVGANCYYLMVYAATPDLRKHIDEVFGDAKKMGVKVIRTWAFNDGKKQWNALQMEPGSYKESTFVGLDYVVMKAKEHGIHLILTLGNNWNQYGGIKQYLEWSPTAATKTHNEFFTDKAAQDYYKDHIRAVLTRQNTKTGIQYKDEPIIMAWELLNEPRVDGDRSGDILNDWISRMSSFVKSIDANHLVSTGSEGFYRDRDAKDWKLNGSNGGDFIRNHSMDSVDIASFHLWPCTTKYCLTLEGAAEWIRMHAKDSRKINKPLILGEYGELRGQGGSLSARDRLYRLVLDLAEEEGIAGTNFWALLSNSYRQYDDGCGVYYPDDKSTVDIIGSASEKIPS